MRMGFFALAAAGLVAATGAQLDKDASYTAIDRDAEPLRSAFNADVGKVRVLMLVAPT